MSSAGASSGAGDISSKGAQGPTADAGAPADEIVKFDTFQTDLETNVTDVSISFYG